MRLIGIRPGIDFQSSRKFIIIGGPVMEADQERGGNSNHQATSIMSAILPHRLLVVPLVLVMFCPSIGAQPYLQLPRRADLPPFIRGTIQGQMLPARTIDFDGDGNGDYLVIVKNDTSKEPYGFELWYTSLGRVVKRVPKYTLASDLTWFINLDGDPEPELITARGTAEAVDYAVYDQHLTTGLDSLLFYFTPAFLESPQMSKEYYWGNPADVADIVVSDQSGQLLVRCSFEHSIPWKGRSNLPWWQNMVPVILFVGKETRGEIDFGVIRKTEWMTLREIAQRVRR
jgi:hypothetical protein